MRIIFWFFFLVMSFIFATFGAAGPSQFSFPHNTPLYQACIQGDEQEVRCLLADGADPNERSVWHQYPLFVATARNHANIVRLLLQAGARDEDGVALFRSVLARHDDIVCMLVEYGADLSTIMSYQIRPLIPALKRRGRELFCVASHIMTCRSYRVLGSCECPPNLDTLSPEIRTAILENVGPTYEIVRKSLDDDAAVRLLRRE